MPNSSSRGRDRGKQIEPPIDTVTAQSALVARCVLVSRVNTDPIGPGKPPGSEQTHAIERCLNRMKRATEAFGGRTSTQAPATGVLALFLDADAALQAACEVHQRVNDLPPSAGVKLTAQTGLDLGTVLIDEEQVIGEAIDHADALARLGKPDQICASAEVVRRLSPAFAALGHALPEPATSDGTAQAAFAFVRSEIAGAASSTSVATARSPIHRLLLNLGNDTVIVDARHSVRTLGRDIGNDLSVNEPRASRIHARIELRANAFVLVDVSRNGTFVQLDSGRQIVLRQQEMELPERGQIGLGRPCAADSIHISFEIARR